MDKARFYRVFYPATTVLVAVVTALSLVIVSGTGLPFWVWLLFELPGLVIALVMAFAVAWIVTIFWELLGGQ